MSKYIVKKEQCDKHNISVAAVYYLIALYENSIIDRNTFEELGKTGYIDYRGYDENGQLIAPVITEEGVNLITDIFINGDISAIDERRYEDIATKMRELFPKGKKEGTNHMWRDSAPIIARRLKLLFKKYNRLFTEKEILDATKRYVDSFNGDYRYMQLLKYFISKQKIEDGCTVEESQLLSYLTNEDQVNTTNDEWTTELR